MSGTALVRNISEVTDSDGPLGKSADHHTAMLVSSEVFYAIHSVHRAYATMPSAGNIPSTIQEALASPDWFLETAINKELDAHRENHTRTMTPLLASRWAIGCRWVLAIKDNTTPPTYKDRLVAHGCRHVHGNYYGETFSPVVRYENIRVLSVDGSVWPHYSSNGRYYCILEWRFTQGDFHATSSNVSSCWFQNLPS